MTVILLMADELPRYRRKFVRVGLNSGRTSSRTVIVPSIYMLGHYESTSKRDALWRRVAMQWSCEEAEGRERLLDYSLQV